MSVDLGPLWDRWGEVDALLDQVLDLPPEHRDAFLETACSGDPVLLRTIQALLRIGDDTELDEIGPPLSLVRAALTDRSGGRHIDAPESLVGTVIGPYRLIDVLGVGGMGAVYLGERADGAFERRVAVKVLHGALHYDGLLERFTAERQILASLNHPGIAQLLDGGSGKDGRPYLVMERIEGVSILRHIDQRGLGVDDRIRLFFQVADAVEYAHRHMVVHRDVKPSNVLVSDEGQVKLLDFGIAKLVESHDGEAALFTTQPGVRFATPGYAAPEQLLGQRVSAQTDVYSLAALLYEMLTGCRPYADCEPGHMLERMIRGSGPLAPSVVVTAPPNDTGRDPDPATTAAVDSTRAALRRRLSGDIDAILLKGLRTRPEERYASVAALRDDLRRHLAGLPVSARGDAFAYQARRFVGRHRLPLALAMMAFMLTFGSAVGLAVQRSAVLMERDRAEAALIDATIEAETARQVTDFLVDIFRAADPSVTRGETVTVTSLLERGTERIEEELADQPDVHARLLAAMGGAYMNIGSYDAAMPLFERSVEIRRDRIDGEEEYVAALLHLAYARLRARAHAPAVAAYHDALDAATRGGRDEQIVLAESGLGNALLQYGMTDSAEVVLRGVIDRGGEVPDRVRNSALNSMAGILRRRGDLTGAVALYTELGDAYRASGSAAPAVVVEYLNNLAIVRRMQGEYGHAVTLYREAIDTIFSVLGPGHPETLLILGNLARTLTESGREEEAIDVYRARVAHARERWPEGHWEIANALMNLGGSLVDAGRAEQAIEPLVEAVAMATEQLGASHSWTHVYRGWLATALALDGRTAESEEMFRASLRGLAPYEGQANISGMLPLCQRR